MKQEIFDFFVQEHNITLLGGQWADIVNLVDSELKVENKALKEKVEWATVDYKSFRIKYDAVKERRDELFEENKVLKERLKKIIDLVVDYKNKMVKVEQSRDELLVACKILCMEKHDSHIHSVIKKAETLKIKEKETK